MWQQTVLSVLQVIVQVKVALLNINFVYIVLMI